MDLVWFVLALYLCSSLDWFDGGSRTPQGLRVREEKQRQEVVVLQARVRRLGEVEAELQTAVQRVAELEPEARKATFHKVAASLCGGGCERGGGD